EMAARRTKAGAGTASPRRGREENQLAGPANPCRAGRGPAEKEHWVRPRNFDLFFTRDVPATPAERRDYARDILSRFTLRAFRRPVDERSLERLVAIAEGSYNAPGKRFEDGVAQAMVPVLASPRFLFRVEATEPSTHGYPFVDEYALASRLSYF